MLLRFTDQPGNQLKSLVTHYEVSLLHSVMAIQPDVPVKIVWRFQISEIVHTCIPLVRRTFEFTCILERSGKMSGAAIC